MAEEYAAVGQSTTLPIAGPSAPDDDPLTDILRRGARALLAQAVEAEVAAYLQARSHHKDEAGRRQVVRNGHLPERAGLTGVGPVEVKQPRVRDRRPAGERESFSSAILPPYLRKTKSLEDLIPWLYLKGVSTGDFTDALKALLGPDAPGLSATTVTRLKAAWEAEHDAWSKRSLAGKRYVYVWADGAHFNIRLEQDRQCILALMGATADGTKELIAVADGYRESEQSWRELLLDVKARGLEVDPALAVGDGALGFWKAVRQVWPATTRPAAVLSSHHPEHRKSIFRAARTRPDRCKPEAGSRGGSPATLATITLSISNCKISCFSDSVTPSRRERIQSVKAFRSISTRASVASSVAGAVDAAARPGPSPIRQPSAPLPQLFQADYLGLISVDQPALLAVQSLELGLQRLGLLPPGSRPPRRRPGPSRRTETASFPDRSRAPGCGPTRHLPASGPRPSSAGNAPRGR